VRALAQQATELSGGHVDILVNNAAVFPYGSTPRSSTRKSTDVFAVNVRAPFILVGQLAPRWRPRARARFVNVGTMAARFGVVGLPLYGASKAARWTC